MTKAQMRAQVRKESGIRHNRQLLSLRDWIVWLSAHSDYRAQSVAQTLRYGLSTGRLPNFTQDRRGERFFTVGGRALTNGQMADLVADAMLAENPRDELRVFQAAANLRMM